MNRQEERRKKTTQRLKSEGVSFLEGLPYVESSEEIKLKSLDEICKRAYASIISINYACDLSNGEDSKEYFEPILEQYGVKDSLNSAEKRLFDGEYSEQDVLDVCWEFECYWSLLWAVGMVDDDKLCPPTEVCDSKMAIILALAHESIDNFKKACKLRDVEDILDMVDLFYNYHWAVVDKNLNPETNIGDINPEVAWERRRGLEWLISSESDWHEISLDT